MALMPENSNARESASDIWDRFITAQDGVPSEEQRALQYDLRADIASVAEKLNAEVADSREKSLAITHLEEALMWAGKAIFR